jgi:hypothetical protein
MPEDVIVLKFRLISVVSVESIKAWCRKTRFLRVRASVPNLNHQSSEAAKFQYRLLSKQITWPADTA